MAGAAVVAAPTQHGHSTLGATYGFDPKKEAEALRAAMRGAGTDEKALIKILGGRSIADRLAISRAFHDLYAKGLEAQLSSETSGNFCRLLKRLVRPVANNKADYLYEAMDGVGTKNHWLIDVLTQSNNMEIKAIKHIYDSEHKSPLETRVHNETSGNFQKCLDNLTKGQREEPAVVDEKAASDDAAELYKAGEKKLGTDDSTFVKIITTRSAAHMLAVDRHYQTLRKKSVLDAIKSETSGNYMDTLLACSKSRETYFAERVRESIKGVGTNDNVLIYVLTVNDKPELQAIDKVYQTKYGKTMADSIKDDTSGNYRDLLLEIIKPL